MMPLLLAATFVQAHLFPGLLAQSAPSNWLIAVAIVVTLVLLTVLAVGWYHALAPHIRGRRHPAKHGWLYVALVGLIASATPLLPAVFAAGMQRYGRVPMAPFVVLLKR